MTKFNKNTCINEFDRSAISVEKALSMIVSTIKNSQKYEKMNLKNSLGRIAAENIVSKINIPTFKNSAMDGYAINTKNLLLKNNFCLKEVGVSYAGKPYLKKLNKDETVKVMTGAVIPKNANAVIMKEMTRTLNGLIKFPERIKAGQNVRSSIGIQNIKVIKKPVVAFFSTGDELTQVGKKLKEGQIYDSNRYLLHGLLSELPVEVKDMGVVKDNKKKLKEKFLKAAMDSDFIITTGGVSVGEADYVKKGTHGISACEIGKVKK